MNSYDFTLHKIFLKQKVIVLIYQKWKIHKTWYSHLCRRQFWLRTATSHSLFCFSALDFLHQKFAKFIVNHDFRSNKLGRRQGYSSETNRQFLTELVLKLLRVNGTPLLDISLDLAPRNSSTYISVLRVPQRSGLLPRLVQSRKEMALFNRWVSKPLNFHNNGDASHNHLLCLFVIDKEKKKAQ